LGQSTLVVLCAGSTLLLAQSYAQIGATNKLSGALPSQLASTFGSGFFLLLVRLNLGFILRKTCRCAHHTFLLGFPTGWLAPPIKPFSGAVAKEKEDFCKGSLSLPILYFVIVLLIFFTLFLLASFCQKYKKFSSFIVVIFSLSAFSLARKGTPENTKLCDFTSTNNNDFISTPIAPPAPEANFYEIKPALLNLVMKEQFSGVSTDDAALISIILLSYVRCKSTRM
jgi:hypothetical protein